MNFLRKLKSSAMFIEILLVLAAAVTVIGLATFIHLNGSKSPAKTKPVSTITANGQHIETIPDTTPTQTTSAENSDVKGAHTDQPSTSAKNTLPANACSSLEKAHLQAKFNQAIDAENKRYQSQLSALTQQDGTLENTLDEVVSNHKSVLNQIESDYKNGLNTINCTL